MYTVGTLLVPHQWQTVGRAQVAIPPPKSPEEDIFSDIFMKGIIKIHKILRATRALDSKHHIS